MKIEESSSYLKSTKRHTCAFTSKERRSDSTTSVTRYQSLIEEFMLVTKELPNSSATSECLFLAAILIEEASFSLVQNRPTSEAESLIRIAATVEQEAHRIANID